MTSMLALLSGCASYGNVANTLAKASDTQPGYSLREFQKQLQSNEKANNLTVTLSFSGGGTRAAAMAFGVLLELRDTQIKMGAEPIRLLDEVDHISSVSGGSFTASFYGLHGEAFFDTFKDEFLRLDMNKALAAKLVNPVQWFNKTGRTDSAIEYYDKELFHGATFADMNKPGRPMIIINSSDLAYGVRFSFIQEYFQLLCSDLSSYPISYAVAASSAVPVVFNPVVLQNLSGCETDEIHWASNAKKMRGTDAEFDELYTGLSSYHNKSERKFIHMVDGGITDNTGLRAIHDLILVAGGVEEYLKNTGAEVRRRMVVIAVNASTNRLYDMDQSPKQPSIAESISAMSNVQLHRYNAATTEELESGLKQWSDELSTPENPISTYFIPVSFEAVDQPKLKLFLNKIPTNFGLSDEEVDALIESGRSILRNNPEFKRLLSDLGASGAN